MQLSVCRSRQLSRLQSLFVIDSNGFMNIITYILTWNPIGFFHKPYITHIVLYFFLFIWSVHNSMPWPNLHAPCYWTESKVWLHCFLFAAMREGRYRLYTRDISITCKQVFFNLITKTALIMTRCIKIWSKHESTRHQQWQIELDSAWWPLLYLHNQLTQIYFNHRQTTNRFEMK